jgi:hypothetical protein
MTPEHASQLRSGDRVVLNIDGTPTKRSFKVVRVNLVSLGDEAIVSVELMDDEGREGVVTGDMLELMEAVPGAEPKWWGELMGVGGDHEGPLD